jgi:hypothetical protein
MTIRQCDQEEHERHFSVRSFNSPDYETTPKEQFDGEFDAVVASIAGVMEQHSGSWDKDPDREDFMIYWGHNDTRFVDVAFEHSGFLDEDLLAGLQKISKAHGSGWMICLWFTNSVFVTPDEVIVYPEDLEELPEWLSTRLIIGS